MNNKNDINILDCENLESILTCLENIFGTQKDNIITFLRGLDFDSVFEKSKKEKYGYEYLYDEFLKNFTVDFKPIKAFWFHNTRVPKHTDFSEGILPLLEALPRVECFIDKIVINLGLQLNKTSAINDDGIQHKSRTGTDPGPWGFLIKEFAFEVPSGIHDYLDLPEIVKHIIDFKYKPYYDIVLKEYRKSTIPCIVKFESEREFHPDNLAYVIQYLYNKINKLENSMYSNTNYSNCGLPIKADKIVNVTFYNN